MFIKVLFFCFSLFCLPLPFNQHRNIFLEKGQQVEKDHQENNKEMLANLFANIILEENPHVLKETKESLQKTSLFLFEKLFPKDIEYIEKDPEDPYSFVLNVKKDLIGSISKVESGGKNILKALKFKTKDKVPVRFSKEEGALYIEDESFWGKVFIIPKKYFLKKVKLEIENDPSSTIWVEIQLENSFYRCKENEVFAHLEHMQWQ